jgi:hypothetical protein
VLREVSAWNLYLPGLVTNQTCMPDSFASRYQSRRYGGYVPRDSMFAEFQSSGATSDDDDGDDSTPVLAVSWLSGIGAVFVLGRTWGWWD